MRGFFGGGAISLPPLHFQPCKVSLAIFPSVSQIKVLWKLSNNRPESLNSILCQGAYLKAHHRPLGVGGGSALTKAPLHLFWGLGFRTGSFNERFL